MSPAKAETRNPWPLLAAALRCAGRALEVRQARLAGRPPRRLMFLILILTQRCNCQCRVCDIWRTPAADLDRELATEDWLSALDAARRLETMAVSFTGGEPLLRPDLPVLLRRAADLDMRTHVCSNGLLLDEALARRLDAAGLDSISLSLDGPDRGTHDWQRGVEAFDRMVAGACALRRVAPRIKVGFNYVLNRRNFRLARQALCLARDLGAHSIRFAPIHTNLQHRRRPAEAFQDLQIPPEAVADLRRELAALGRAAARTPMHRNSRLFLDLTPAALSRRVPFCCLAGYASCVIGPDGAVAPCPDMDSELSVTRAPLDRIWRSAAFHRLRRRARTCDRPCWDSTYAELGLRLTLRSFLRDPLQVLQETAFYLGG